MIAFTIPISILFCHHFDFVFFFRFTQNISLKMFFWFCFCFYINEIQVLCLFVDILLILIYIFDMRCLAKYILIVRIRMNAAGSKFRIRSKQNTLLRYTYSWIAFYQKHEYGTKMKWNQNFFPNIQLNEAHPRDLSAIQVDFFPSSIHSCFRFFFEMH